MNLQEALLQLAKGKKIRPVEWTLGSYLYFKNGKICDETDCPFDCNYNLFPIDEWELHEEIEDPLKSLNESYLHYCKTYQPESYMFKKIIIYLNSIYNQSR